jgi:hypothetical protein
MQVIACSQAYGSAKALGGFLGRVVKTGANGVPRKPVIHPLVSTA